MAIELDVVTKLNERSVQTAASRAQQHWERSSRDTGVAVERNLTSGYERVVRNTDRMSVQLERSFNRVADATGRTRLEQERYDTMVRAGEQDRVKLIQQSERLATAKRNEAAAVRRAASEMSNAEQQTRRLGQGFDTVIDQANSLGASTRFVAGGLGLMVAPVVVQGLMDLAGVAVTATQSIALLPAVISTAGAAFGTLALATSNFGEAIESIRDPEKFAEELQKLSPAAQQAALSIRNLLPEFDGLKAATQEALFSGMGEEIHRLSTEYLPGVQDLTTGIADSFNVMAKSVANELMTPETQSAIQNMFSNITASFRELSPAASSLTQAFVNIANAGSGFLPGLAQAASQAAQQFAAFIDQASRTGDLQRWIQQGIDAVKSLGDAIWMVGGFIYDTFGSDGQQNVENFNDTLQGTADILAMLNGDFSGFGDDIAQELSMLTGPAAAVRDAVLDIPEALSVAGNAVIDMANSVKHGLDWMGQNFTNFMNTILPGQDRTFTPLPDIPQLPAGGDWGGYQPPGFDAPDRTEGTYRDRQGNERRIPTPRSPGARPYPGQFDVPTATGGPGAGAGGRGAYGYTSDQALLSSVPAGVYSQTGAADLTQGIGDCTSAIEDLIAMIDGRTTEGRSMSTANAHEWLTSRGFLPGSRPGAFNVGFNEGHMQATLPGGTPFNWGSPSAAARRGIGGTGAFDPAFTSHYYRPVDTGATPYQSGIQGVSVESFGSSAQSDLSTMGGTLGNQLDQDFGISKGLPGLAENAVKFVGNLFFAPLLTALQAIAGANPNEGSGLIGMMTAGGGGGTANAGAAMGSSAMFSGGPSAMGPAGLQPPWSADWNAIAQKESSGNWGINTGNGYSGGLQFAPSSWEAAGGTQYAPAAHLATPFQQAMAAENLLKLQGPGAWPNTFTPGSSGPSGAAGPGGGAGVLGMPFGGGGSMLPGTGMPQAGGPLSSGGLAYPAQGGGGFGGLGGLPMDAAMMATTGLDAIAPGAGAAAKVGIQLANRAVAYMGQVAGIGMSGLFETLSLGDNPMGSLGKSWFGKLAGGFAGARPATGNMAGGAAPATPSNKDPRAAAQAGLAAGKGGDTNITVNNNRQTEDGTGRDIAWHVYSQPGKQ